MKELSSNSKTPLKLSLIDSNNLTIKISKKLIIIVSILILLLVLTSTLLIYREKHKYDNQKDVHQITSLVNKHYLLPTNEVPTLATITDRNSLDHTSFLYQKGKNGDKILIYVNASRVILYRPSIDKVIDTGPVVVDQGIPESKGASIIIKNSTNNAQSAANLKAKIEKAYPGAKVSIGSSTNKTNFPNTIIIDNTNQKDYFVNDLTSLTNGKRGVVPLSEEQTNSDLEIIIGTDYHS